MKHLKSEFAKSLKAKCVATLQIVHWKAILLNPLSRATTFSNAIPNDYNKRDEAVTQLKSEISAVKTVVAPRVTDESPPKKRRKS